MLKAVIFDMDGVIIDSEPQHARAAILALQKYDVNITMDYLQEFIGSTAYYMCQKMITDFKINVSPEELLQANNEMKAHLLQMEGHIIVPYIIELIQDLYKSGLKLIIASSSPGEAIEEVMDTLNIRRYFEGYVSGMNVKHPKPAPDIFLKAADSLGVAPSECIVIEDSNHGVNAARAAGMACIGFINPNSGNQDLRKASFLIEGFDEVDYSFLKQVYQQEHRTPVTILNTTHCSLRELSIEDADDLFQIYSNEGVRPYIKDFSQDFDTEREKLRGYIESIYPYYDYGLWGIYLRTNEKLIGRCGIEFKMVEGEKVYELGYLLDPAYQGQGLATEVVKALISYCFQSLNINRIMAFIDKSNKSSQRLAERIGMSPCGEVARSNITYVKYQTINNYQINN